MGLFGTKNTSAQGGSLYAEFKNEHKAPEYKSTSGKVSRMAREDVVITSMCPGCGATYFSAAVANYLVDVNRGRTAFIGDSKDSYVDSILRTSILKKEYPTDVEDLYNLCECVVQDIGEYQKLDKNKTMALSRATTKIVVCHADDDCMKRVAEFARERTDADRFYYVFNVLPDEWKKKVYKTMNIYEAYCLPLFSAKNTEKEVTLILRKILGR